jgi:predicted DNA-binding ArsR family transcriptional regulator
LKYANIIPCFKKGDTSEIADYRPVSLLTGFSKMLEILVANRLNQHMISNDILAHEQYGFRKDSSTQIAVFKLTNDILEAWNKKEYVMGIFCDLTKTFDCVNHELLIQKLMMNGVNGPMLKWLESYLNSRMQRVVLHSGNANMINSEWKTVKFGVPQGSVLGPMLFNVYINDFPGSLKNIARIVLYADDRTTLVTSNDLVTLNEKLNRVMNIVSSWFRNNSLVLNLSKTHLIKFVTPKSPEYTLSVIYNNFRLKVVDNVKFLGI